MRGPPAPPRQRGGLHAEPAAARLGAGRPVSGAIAGTPLTKTPAPNAETDVKPACLVVLGAAEITV